MDPFSPPSEVSARPRRRGSLFVNPLLTEEPVGEERLLELAGRVLARV